MSGEAGTRVTGVDLAPEVLARAGAAAERAGLEIAWIEGDAEALPLPDGSADAVVSSFGCIFAPRHEAAAREPARVLRPGGRMAVATWTTDSSVAKFLRAATSRLPPPPPSAGMPILWGDEAHVREVFAGTGVELSFERGRVALAFPSPEAATEEYLTRFGPLVAARAMLEPQGRWQPLADDVAAYYDRQPRRADGRLAIPGDYIVIAGRLPG